MSTVLPCTWLRTVVSLVGLILALYRALAPDDQGDKLRAVVIVRDGTPKDGQRYVDPLLVLTGEEYEKSTFSELHGRICDALRGSRPEVVMEAWGPDGSVRLLTRDGSPRLLDREGLRRSRG